MQIFQLWKVMESFLGAGKSWKFVENQPNGCLFLDPCTPKPVCWPGLFDNNSISQS